MIAGRQIFVTLCMPKVEMFQEKKKELADQFKERHTAIFNDDSRNELADQFKERHSAIFNDDSMDEFQSEKRIRSKSNNATRPNAFIDIVTAQD